jgi:uncharacterized protein
LLSLKKENMLVTVFGATSPVGKQLVTICLQKGFIVRAYGRNVFSELPLDNENLQIIRGGLFDDADVRKAIDGTDAIFTALGTEDFSFEDKSRSLGIKTIVVQMEKIDATRIIVLSGYGVLNNTKGELVMDEEDFNHDDIPISLEHKRAADYLANSKANYTIVCPRNVINDSPIGKFIAAENTLPNQQIKAITTGDVALFMVNCFEKNNYLKTKVALVAS